MASTADKPSKKPAAKGKAPAEVAAKEPAKPRVSRQRSPTHAAIAKRALAGIAILRNYRKVEHLVDVHIVEYEHGAVAAEFHRRPLHAVCRQLHQLLADGHRARERNGANDG